MLKLLSVARHFCTAKKLNYRFQHGSFMVPHPQKAHKGGEDAVFVSDNVLLVNDGVGGWASSGVDPALYSKKLAKIVEELITKDKIKYIQNPKLLIKDAVALNKEIGSTTVCLLTLHPDSGCLQCYYLGDSVYAIIDPDSQGYRKAPQQQYEFNFPVQVGTNGADPQSGVLHTYQANDIKSEQLLVVASDGVWDNVKDFMIYQLVTTPELSLVQKAQKVARLALYFGTADNYQSPFHQKAIQAGLDYPKQGKLDDNSIIVAKIIKEEL